MKQTKLALSVAIAAVLGLVVGGLSSRARVEAAGASLPNPERQTKLQNVSLHGHVAAVSALDVRTTALRALKDAVATWQRRIHRKAEEIGLIQLTFVNQLSPRNCYGLYAGEGPVYCSGNQTVFVGTKAAGGLMARFGQHGEAGLSFLIGHEVGHHIQNIHGRFRWLRHTVRSDPSQAVDLIRRFELEADCLAGVWVHDSRAWIGSRGFQLDLIAAVRAMGDESVMADEKTRSAEVALHGTSEQRVHWFKRGLNGGSVKDCNTFLAAAP